MSRSGYNDGDGDEWSLIRWRGQVASAIRGKRGQAFLRELVEALDDLPDRRLIKDDVWTPVGVCAIGAVGKRRNVDMITLDAEDYDRLADVFGIAHQLVREIEWENDDVMRYATPEERWLHVRAWAIRQIRGEQT